ncbi:MAG: hypothetical protein ACOCYE_11620 [Pseudomonadota bacterium]
MLFTFLGTIVLGLGAAGTWMLLTKALRIPAPRWTIPVVAGGSMLIFHIYIEYSWFQRTTASLPPQVEVARSETYRSPLQPWTLIVPQVNRFVAVDTGRVQTHPDHPDLALAEVVFVTRYYPTIATRQLYDCAAARRADILSGTPFGADGLPERIDWIALEPDDTVRSVVCAAAARSRAG